MEGPTQADLAMATPMGGMQGPPMQPPPTAYQMQPPSGYQNQMQPQMQQQMQQQMPSASSLQSLMPVGQEWSTLLLLAVIVFITTHTKVQQPLVKAIPSLYGNDEARSALIAAVVAVTFHVARIKLM